MSFTLTELTTLCRLDGEIPNSITDDELAIWIKEVAREVSSYLYKLNPMWSVKTATITLTGTETYPLLQPQSGAITDFYKMVNCAYTSANGDLINIYPISLSQRAGYVNANTPTSGHDVVYYLIGNTSINILPAATTGTLTVHYVPNLGNTLSDNNYPFDDNLGLASYISLGVTERYLGSRGLDTSYATGRLEAKKRELKSEVAIMNPSYPLRVQHQGQNQMRNVFHWLRAGQ